jgi:large subunit ribosomal protein L33
MPREIVTIECTEARKENKPPSRYMTTRNKKLAD